MLLETRFPVVHELLDIAVRKRGVEHGYLLQSMDSLRMIETLLGKEAKREAVLHILQNWGVITTRDVEITKEILKGKEKSIVTDQPKKTPFLKESRTIS